MSDGSEGKSLPPTFTLEGDTLIPSTYARGPWRDDTLHGSVMMGLLARAAECHPADKPVQVARLTIDLARAAPLAPVTLTCRSVRTGRLVETLDAGIVDGDGAVVVRGTAMRFRTESIDTSSLRQSAGIAERYADAGWSDPRGTPFYARCLELLPGRTSDGPMVWVRMRVPFVAGEEPSPLLRAAVASDFAYGSSMLIRARSESGYDPEPGFSTINADTNLHLQRPVEGEWVGIEPQIQFGDVGAATASARMWDERGPVGVATQSVLVRSGEVTRSLGWKKIMQDRKP